MSLDSTVQPFEALNLPTVPPSEEFDGAMRALAIACNGSVYHGSALEAQFATVKMLRARPDLARALGIGAELA